VILFPPSNEVFVAVLSPEDHIGITKHYTGVYVPGTGLHVEAMPFAVYVGDNYILELEADAIDVLTPPANFWPTLVRANSPGTEYLSAQPDHERKSISYIDSMFLGGLGRPLHRFALFATGWENATTRYRFGITGMYFTDPAHPTTTRVPVCFVASTGAYTMTQVAFPLFAGRDHLGFNTFTAAPGKLQALNFVNNLGGTAVPQINPYMSYSEDHGNSWAASSVPWLLPFVNIGDDVNQEQMALFATIHYLGAGKTLLLIPNGYRGSGLGYCPMAFLGTGLSYVRIAWPADSWDVDHGGGLTVGNSNMVGVTNMQEPRGAHFAFGVGCFYTPVFEGGAWKIMFTHDFGTSWSISAAVPPNFVTAGSDINGVMVSPFTGTKRGRIIFAAPDYVRNQLRFYSTTGDFAEFKDLGPVVKPQGTIYPTAIDSINYCYVNYGGAKFKPTVFPAFPGEFDKP
jgi:hypothetical protein